MNDEDEALRLERVLGQSGLARLMQRLRQHFERGSSARAVVLREVSAEEHRAIAGLLGKTVARGRSLRVDLRDLETALQRGALAPDLRSAITALQGPLRDLSAERLAEDRAWKTVFENARRDVSAQTLRPWLDALQYTGLLKRLSGGSSCEAARQLNDAQTVLARLPERGIPLSTLAANALGDAHALDAGQPAATLVLGALRRATADADRELSNEAARELWAGAGVLVGGAITSTALALNLPVRAAGLRADDLAMAVVARGEPLWLTLRQLVRSPPQWLEDCSAVFVCENPAVIAEAADRFGTDCAPLICTSGQPSAAVALLLESLRATGVKTRYHGDFDWAGLTIANGLVRRFGVAPWRFGRDDYEAAANQALLPLRGRPVEADWDAGLGEAMREIGLAVPEEAVMSGLLEDLGS